MIKVNNVVVTPTIFPDGTSQIWKLPEGMFSFAYVKITWYFESERELMDLYSIKALIPDKCHVTLYMPYMPYARQDKDISNTSTFNLFVFADLINALNFDAVLATDVHNVHLTKALIRNFQNLGVDTVQEGLFNVLRPDYIAFPDSGAAKRYQSALRFAPSFTFSKVRNPLTGRVSGCKLENDDAEEPDLRKRWLILDDICDGGATFIQLAELLYEKWDAAEVSLFTTHGIYSKGKEILTNAGIKLYTTNSLLKNIEGLNV